MTRCYDLASLTPKRCAMRSCFNSFVYKESLIKKFRRDTIKQYSVRIAPILFLLLRVNRLSIFAAYKKPRGSAGYTEIDTGKLQTAFADKESRDIDVTYLSQVCVDMMKGKDTLGHVLETLVMCCAIKFGSSVPSRFIPDDSDNEEDEDEDDETHKVGTPAAGNDDMKGIRNPKSARGIRKTLDSLKAFLTFACMCSAADDDLFDDESGTPMWKWITTVYHKTVEEEENLNRYQISLVPSAQGIMILGKLFDRSYIRDFYFECHSVFRENFEKLDKLFFMPTVDQIAGAILRNRDVSFREAKRGTDKFWDGGSLLHLIPVEYRQVLMPKFRREKHGRLSEAVNKQVAHAVDEIACTLMWMVYFAAGFPYRFPELQLLAFSGPQRNVYVEDVSRRVQLFCDYNKTGATAPILKTTSPPLVLFHCRS
ncbi:hypothetical protein HG536_0D00110 [Torulaspora globosa]|uniref:Uncharacterized protein n=1 Tax=Torulaspora globosa TaxID=48254 RepID=A0A7G3ZG53_9SACH|nr:uncharacterized protein HG536_0A00110 [Torulaspora globosa]XP_037139164.1 uncharacterized protein HG536_0D00110 [Torulaspora globosa]QLL30194.1 hypothetical protein HG536_0A00110 [Torulaspora globosa]QLL32489.1 hypothetical protein HG536_0D00110 [Torulaspora globosa]